MKVRLICQPFADSSDLLQVLRGWLSDGEITHLDVAVAWVKRSGFNLLQSDVASFRRRGGVVRLIVGISAGGATRQGLELALMHSDECSVLFLATGRTFHPKFYIAYGPKIGRAVIGSQNLTRGGLVDNFELGIELIYDLDQVQDAEDFAVLRNTFEKYRDVGKARLLLNDEVLSRLMQNPRYRISDEDQPAYVRGVPAEVADSEDPSVADEELFGRCELGLKAAPHVSDDSSSTPNRTGRPETAGSPILRWHKQLSAADAQHPVGLNTNPTGHLTLVRAGHNIEHATWFREHLFAGANWSAGPVQYATVEFRFEANRKSLGTLPLRVQFRPAFGAGQGNRTSMLHWGQTAGELLKQKDFTGWYVSIERYADNSYAIWITRAPIGPAITEPVPTHGKN